MPDTRHVYATYDPAARVWWTESEDPPGLVPEAPTLDVLIDRVTAVAGELLAVNGATAGAVNLEFITRPQVQMA